MSINKRIREIIEKKEKTQAAFAARLSVSKQYVSQIVNSDSGVGMELVNKILDAYKDINGEWLVTGEGQIFRGRPYPVREEDDQSDVIDAGIPVYEVPASAGGVEVYSDMSSQTPSGYVQIPGFEDCNFAIPVWGDSMYPAYKNGSYVLGKWIGNPQSIAWGECYYIEWGDYRMVKILVRGKSEEDVLLCSVNEAEISRGRVKYAPISIKKQEIRKLALIKGSFTKNNH